MQFSQNYDIKLNPSQEQAVTHKNGAALVLAGPGSGKTTVIITRTAFLILNENIRPENILTLTYNRAAKYEMEHRFKRVFGKIIPEAVRFSTFHSLCKSIVDDYQRRQRKWLKIIEGENNQESKVMILKDIYKKINGQNINEDQLEDLISNISLVKNKMIDKLEDIDFSIKNFEEIFKEYEKLKKEKLFMDYDDMLTYARLILMKCPDILINYKNQYRYIQIDEGQDLSKIQFEILKLLVDKKENELFIVADDDQSIYGFRGAEPQYIIDINHEYKNCKLFKLEENYRSTKDIVELTSAFIKNNKVRYDKAHKTTHEYKYEPVICSLKNEQEQLNFILQTVNEHLNNKKSNEIGILFRNNLSAIPILDVLEENGIKTSIKQNKMFFFKHWLVQDILSFLKFSLKQLDIEAFKRICFRMNRYISKAMLEQALEKKNNESILDNILEIIDKKAYQFNKISDIKYEFKRMAKMSAKEALEYIEYDFNYFEGIKEYCKNTGQAFEYIYYIFGILKMVANRYKTIESFLERINQLDNLFKSSKVDAKTQIALSTFHSSKGLEYQCVLMVDLVQDEIPGKQAIELSKSFNNAELEEERRLFYVAMTRAKEYLYLIHPVSKNNSRKEVSLFIEEAARIMNKKLAEQIGEGQLVKHKRFGEGAIVRVLEEKNGSVFMEIDFKGKIKKLDLKLCVQNGLLSF